jgi:hypothetical protein
MFSLLLIIAFRYAHLLAKIRAIPSYFKHYIASVCDKQQKNMCGIVRLCGNCAVKVSGRNLCGNCAGILGEVFRLHPPKQTRLLPEYAQRRAITESMASGVAFEAAAPRGGCLSRRSFLAKGEERVMHRLTSQSPRQRITKN